MKNSIFIIIFFLLGLGLGVFIKKSPAPTTIVKTDTLTITKIDTFRIVKPIYINKKIIDTSFVYISDTLFVPVAIEQKLYKGNNYEAYISGYNANLDSIKTFNTSTVKYITKEIKVKERGEKWGIGAQIGYGYNGNKLSPYIGLGIQYNFIRF